ncbi:MAG: hypothetical protein AMJ65_02025, partial [Phycisphaerae bacterium SG8_4]
MVGHEAGVPAVAAEMMYAYRERSSVVASSGQGRGENQFCRRTNTEEYENMRRKNFLLIALCFVPFCGCDEYEYTIRME